MSLSKITQLSRSSRTFLKLTQPAKLVVQNAGPKRYLNFKNTILPYGMSDSMVAKIAIATLIGVCGISNYCMFPTEGFGNKEFSTKKSDDEASLLAAVFLSKLTPLNSGPDGQLNGFALAQYKVEQVIANLNKKIQNCSDADEQKNMQSGKKLFEDMLNYIAYQRKHCFGTETCITDVYLAVGKEAAKHELSQDELDKIIIGVVGSKEEMNKKSKAYQSEMANEAALAMRPKLLKLKEDPEAFAKLEKMLATLPPEEIKAFQDTVTLREPDSTMKGVLEKMLVMQDINERGSEPSLDDIRQQMRSNLH